MPGKWIPLECNPEVLNSWSKQVGVVTSQFQFTDVYGLDPELLALVPRPVLAVVLLFPLNGKIKEEREKENEKYGKEPQPIDHTIFYIKQTIRNACGTMGLLHALTNSPITIAPESALEKYMHQCQDKTPDERAKTLEETSLFTEVHAEAAGSGQSTLREQDMDTDLHFTCFVQAPDPSARDAEVETSHKRIIELDGGRVGPVDRGPVSSGDLLLDVAEFIKKNYMDQSSSMQFGMAALSPPEM